MKRIEVKLALPVVAPLLDVIKELADNLRKNIRQTYYEGGHMMYHHAPSLDKLNKDVTGFMEWATTGKQ